MKTIFKWLVFTLCSPLILLCIIIEFFVEVLFFSKTVASDLLYMAARKIEEKFDEHQ